MTLVNAGLLIILVLLIAIVILLVNLWERMSALSDDVQSVQRLVLDHKARQTSVTSRVGPSVPFVEPTPKTRQRHKGPPTGRQREGMRLVLKGGHERGDEEINRLRSSPDEVHDTKRPTGRFRRIGGSKERES